MPFTPAEGLAGTSASASSSASAWPATRSSTARRCPSWRGPRRCSSTLTARTCEHSEARSQGPWRGRLRRGLRPLQAGALHRPARWHAIAWDRMLCGQASSSTT
eukprot:7109456-Pyramimonas_sp.AAC.1